MFDQIAPGVDESPEGDEPPARLAARLARLKAQAIAKDHAHRLVIGSDQVLEFGRRALGKPGSHERAVEQLRELSGQEVTFHTAVCVIDSDTMQAAEETTVVKVLFRHIDESTIERYLKLDQPYDCAGSAKAESLGIALLARIDSSDPTALIGLPLISVVSSFEKLGWPLFDLMKPA